ncbi:MAG: response regulator transcription factor [Myxococcota bacterium]
MAKILLVDDDPHIREVVCFALEQAGHVVVTASDGEEGQRQASAEDPELVILDILMPKFDGIELCRRIRAKSAVPILFLSSKDDEIDRVIGLEVGGDDYLTKPFSPRELVARVKAMLRRRALDKEPPPAEVKAPKSYRALELDPQRFSVRFEGAPVVLTVTEFGVLDTLLSNPGRVFTRAELVERAYELDNHVTERTIDSHVRRIRKKFDAEGEPIETVYGLGYRLGQCRRGSG